MRRQTNMSIFKNHLFFRSKEDENFPLPLSVLFK